MTTTTRLPRRGAAGAPSRLPYLAGVDGLRALAVAAVLLYHQDLGWARGGFLGVEVFFVLSGYLITTLLVTEWSRSGGINIRRFWTRRWRRLIPALITMLFIVAVLATLFVPDSTAELRGDTAAAVAYVANWWAIFHHQSYFAHMGRPPLLQHLWSLAVEEQFYLVWPVVLLVALRRSRQGLRFALTVAATGAALSLLLMAVLAHPFSDNTRVYFGTDTRGGGLLIGAALALVLAMPRFRSVRSIRGRAAAQLAGLAGLALLAWAVNSMSYYDPMLYRGGFLLVDLATVAVLLAVINPRYAVGRLLGWRPLRWLGLRSYSIYLWHWPVFMVTRPGLDVGLTGLPLFILRVVVTLSLADLSYRLIERRLRVPTPAALGGGVAAPREAAPAPMRRRAPARIRVPAAAVAAVWLVVVFAWPPGPHARTEPVSRLTASHPPPVASPPGSDQIALAPLPVRRASQFNTTPSSAPPAAPAPLSVTAIGDSVMLDAAPALMRDIPNLTVDAVVGRQFSAGVADVSTRVATGRIGDEVILGLGTNGPIQPSQLDQMMWLLRYVRRVVIVNVRVARPWEAEVNSVLAGAVPRWPNAVLVDWYSASVGHRDLFSGDGVHLQPSATGYYANLVVHALWGI